MSESPDPARGRVCTRVQGRVLLITIDRPSKYNGFTPEMLDDLVAAYAQLEGDAELWCGLLVAEGEHFTAGLELSRFDIGAQLVPEDALDPLDLRDPRRTKPVVAVVHGICFTIGIELMLAADIVVAERGVRFCQLEVGRGLMAFGGATIRMVERAGWGNAMRWLLTGEEFDGETALRIGFVQELVEPGEGMARGMTLAQLITQQAPLAVQASRRSAMIAVEQGPGAAVEAFPAQLQALAESRDFAEGVASFLERRPGRYEGR